MIKLIDIIQEGKQVGLLYHFTSYSGLMGIVSDDYTLKPIHPYSKYASFTRNKNQLTATHIPQDVRLTLDGNKLAQRYKIEPFADADNTYSRSVALRLYLKGVKYARIKEEAEERISYLRYPNGVKIKDALIRIEVEESNKGQLSGNARLETRHQKYEELIEFLEAKNIPYDRVTQVKPVL